MDTPEDPGVGNLRRSRRKTRKNSEFRPDIRRRADGCLLQNSSARMKAAAHSLSNVRTDIQDVQACRSEEIEPG